MEQKPTKTATFTYRREAGQNPFTGFTSFQHFRGEKLYSDIVVLPERNFTETERVECYPVSADAEENGREEGYYPDTSMVYIRVLWKEFEPQRGVYNYDFISDILKKAKEHGQTLMLRLMAHSTRACDDVPEWLKKMIPCPERPDGQRVKDSPTAPEFLEYFGEAIRKIGERFDDDPTLDIMDVSLPGAWGEGHNLHLYSEESLRKLMDMYTSVFKKTQLVGQCTLPDLIHYMGNTVPVGWRGDGLGHPSITFEGYPGRIAQVADVWKKAPVSFEAYWWLGEWQRKGWNIDRIIEATLSWHISAFNAKSIPIPYEWEDKIAYWISKMGYHFSPTHFAFPDTAQAGDTLLFALGMENCGVAPIYRKLPLYVRLISDMYSFEAETNVDIRRWLPGRYEEEIRVDLPSDIPADTYDIEIGICSGVYPTVYLATDAPQNGSFYKMGQIVIE